MNWRKQAARASQPELKVPLFAIPQNLKPEERRKPELETKHTNA